LPLAESRQAEDGVDGVRSWISNSDEMLPLAESRQAELQDSRPDPTN
jgi:hypothetical protein